MGAKLGKEVSNAASRQRKGRGQRLSGASGKFWESGASLVNSSGMGKVLELGGRRKGSGRQLEVKVSKWGGETEVGER